ncbi:MAG TPA: hypothetical protein VF532_02440 [Candidatus Angelobacter sp.]
MILAMQVSHFTAAVIFAFFSSIVFAITQRNTTREMVRFGLYCFGVFVLLGLFVGGWLMWLIHH